MFPTPACIALDILPSQVLSVPCKHLFSGSKQIVINCRACLGPIVFEELVIIKLAWRPDLYGMAAWNEAQSKDVNLFDFEEMLVKDTESSAWDGELTMYEDKIEVCYKVVLYLH